MPNNRKGLCVPLKDCPDLKILASKKRLRTADRLYLNQSRCGLIGRSPLVCCPKVDNIRSRSNGAPFEITDLPNDCGRQQLNQNVHINYIVGGTEAKIYDSPWLALLEYKKCK